MAPRRRNQKRQLKATTNTNKDTTNDSLALAPKREEFVWNNERKIALFQCMIKRKPAGLLKHINMQLIKTNLSERLKMDVPTREIWSFLNTHWDMNKVDRIEYPAMFMEKKDFELPQTEEWKNLIEEQGALINANTTDTDVKKQTSQAAIKNVDLSTLKSVKVMVERLDLNLYKYKLYKKK